MKQLKGKFRSFLTISDINKSSSINGDAKTNKMTYKAVKYLWEFCSTSRNPNVAMNDRTEQSA